MRKRRGWLGSAGPAADEWHNRYEEEGVEGCVSGRARAASPGSRRDERAVQGPDCRWRRAGAGRGGGVSRGRRAPNIARGIQYRLQPVEHLPTAAPAKIELVGPASAPPGG